MLQFGPGDDDVPIFLDNLLCRGSESSLLNCNAQAIGVHNCVHLEDAGVVCQGEKGLCHLLIKLDFSSSMPTKFFIQSVCS